MKKKSLSDSLPSADFPNRQPPPGGTPPAAPLPSLAALFAFFLKVGATTFGGGYVIISQLQTELVDKRQWLTADEMLDMMAISESTPGPFAINMATFLGRKLKGFWGAVACTLAFVLPSFAVISLVSLFMDAFLANPILSWAFHGIRIGVILMIGKAFVRFFRQMEKGVFSLLLFAGALICLLFTSVSLIPLLLIGGGLGMLRCIPALVRAKKASAAASKGKP